MNERKSVTIPREIYDALKRFSKEDRQIIFDSLLGTLFDGSPPSKELSASQYMAYVVFAPILRKSQQQFLNGCKNPGLSYANKKSQNIADSSQIEPKDSRIENNNIYINNSFKTNKQTIQKEELEKRNFYITTILNHAKTALNGNQDLLNTLEKVLERVKNEPLGFNISGVIISPTTWLERFLDLFRRPDDEIAKVISESASSAGTKITNNFRYWVAKIYNILGEF